MNNNQLPIVALVGPPNAGKSMLLNKIVGKQLAVTSDVAGTTRDRQYAEVSFGGKDFMLADTAGIDFIENGELEKNVQKQIDIALLEADVIVFVADGKELPGALDKQIITKFRKLKKPKILAVNKLDSGKKREQQMAEFFRLGIKPIFGISALTGLGVGDLLDAIVEILPDPRGRSSGGTPEDRPLSSIAVSIVGKPNVGKSSLFNSILNSERAVVSKTPGTTRAAIDEQIEINGQHFTFIDTAGLKRKTYAQEKPDIFSGFQTFKSIRKSDVCFLVLDACEPITSQDQRIAREIFDMQKGCVIIINKIDEYKGDEQKLRDYISDHFQFLWMCPMFFVSAISKQGLKYALEAIKPIYERRNKQIEKERLSEFLAKRLKINPPKLLRDQKKPKVYSLIQFDINPPTFLLTVNHPAAISMQFRKYLENSIIKELDFYGTPIKLHLKKKIG